MTVESRGHDRVDVFLVACILAAMFLVSPITAASAGEARMDNYQSQTPYPLEQRYNLVKAVQKMLQEKGFDPGPVDGLFGPKTSAALRAFQEANGLDPDGHLNKTTLTQLGIQ